MFELITISNGVAVVQHCPSGQVYRFRPTQPGSWTHFVLDTVDGCRSVDHMTDPLAAAACSFAEIAAAACATTTVLAQPASSGEQRSGPLRRTVAALMRR